MNLVSQSNSIPYLSSKSLTPTSGPAHPVTSPASPAEIKDSSVLAASLREPGTWRQLSPNVRQYTPSQAMIDALPAELRDDEPLPEYVSPFSSQPLHNSGNPERLLLADDVRQFSSRSPASSGNSLLSELTEGMLLLS